MRTFLAYAAVFLICILKRTWRVVLDGPDPDYTAGPLVFCFWHGRQAGLFAHPRPRPVVVMASRSRDGDLQARILGLLGFVVVRGSSSRGGAVGLKGILKHVRAGCDAAFAVDGPRGPAFKVKTGAVVAARNTGSRIIPITTKASSCWTFSRAWDQYQLPKPFATVKVVRGDAIAPCENGEDTRKTVENALHMLG